LRDELSSSDSKASRVTIKCEKFVASVPESPVLQSIMARNRKSGGKPPKEQEPADSEEDMQTLKKRGTASFSRDEEFNDSEDECNFLPGLLTLINSFRAERHDPIRRFKRKKEG